jgi:hypothetical protein
MSWADLGLSVSRSGQALIDPLAPRRRKESHVWRQKRLDSGRKESVSVLASDPMGWVRMNLKP